MTGHATDPISGVDKATFEPTLTPYTDLVLDSGEPGKDTQHEPDDGMVAVFTLAYCRRCLHGVGGDCAISGQPANQIDYLKAQGQLRAGRLICEAFTYASA